ncbi:hypothetical protein THRCLA_07826, partial [Thraustotheca clavata]
MRVIEVASLLWAAASSSLFYILAFSKYIRSSDTVNNMLGYNTAAFTIHQRVLGSINFDEISATYGMPITSDNINVNVTGISMRMHLSGSTADLNEKTGPGSALFFSNTGLSTLGLNVTTFTQACTWAKNTTTGISTTTKSVTSMAGKPDPEMTWAGIKYLPTTIKATTNIVSLTAKVLDKTAATPRCLYNMKLTHQEAFELWLPSMHSFNIYETNFQVNDTGTTPLKWQFHPDEGEFNWFFYRRRSSDFNNLALTSQLLTILIILSGFVRRVMYSTPSGHKKSIFRFQVDPLSSQCKYYNSAIVNFLEVYLIVADRYMFFRTVNALQFFLANDWGFNRALMYFNYANLMGSIFWFVLGIHKIYSIVLYGICSVSKRTFAIKSKKRRRYSHVRYDSKGAKKVKLPRMQPIHPGQRLNSLSGLESRDYSGSFQREEISTWIVLLKEVTRPRPDLILSCMLLFPSVYYAGFFGGATSWAPLNPLNFAALGSNLGADWMMWNLLVCATITLPLNGIYVFWEFKSVMLNGWVQLRQPGRAYFNDIVLIKPNERVAVVTEGQVDSIFGIIKLSWTKRRLAAQGAKLQMAYCLTIHEIINDWFISEFEAISTVLFAIDIDATYGCLVQHPIGPNPFYRHPVCEIANYRHRGLLLTWPRSHKPGIDSWDFQQMFLKRIHVIGVNNDHTFIGQESMKEEDANQVEKELQATDLTISQCIDEERTEMPMVVDTSALVKRI